MEEGLQAVCYFFVVETIERKFSSRFFNAHPTKPKIFMIKMRFLYLFTDVESMNEWLEKCQLFSGAEYNGWHSEGYQLG